MSKIELPKYVYDLLDQISKDNNFNDYTIQLKPGSNAGDGFTSEITSITISENNGEKVLQLVCKLAPLNETRQKDFFSHILFDREATFFNKIMPSFAKFQVEKNLSKNDQFLAYPKCYAAKCDHENEQYFIILDDLRTKGFKMWNKAKISPIESVRLAMRELGKFHGISIAMKDQRPKEFAEFEQITDYCRKEFKREIMANMFDASFDRALTFLKCDDHKNVMRDIKNNLSAYFEYTLTEHNRFAVISHGDFWVNNHLYRFNEKNITEDIRFLDWQLTRYVSPSIDLSYYLFTSIDKAVRDKEYDNLLRFYYESLSKTVKLLGSDPDNLFTFDDLQDELKKYGMFTLTTAPMIIQTSLADSSEMLNLNEMNDKTETENSRQELITGLNETSQSEYGRRLNEVFEDIVDKLGYYHKID